MPGHMPVDFHALQLPPPATAKARIHSGWAAAACRAWADRTDRVVYVGCGRPLLLTEAGNLNGALVPDAFHPSPAGEFFDSACAGTCICRLPSIEESCRLGAVCLQAMKLCLHSAGAQPLPRFWPTRPARGAPPATAPLWRGGGASALLESARWVPYFPCVHLLLTCFGKLRGGAGCGRD